MARPKGIEARFAQAIKDAFEEIAMLAKKNILDAFGKERGYREDGTPVKWPALDEDYVEKRKKDWGSDSPMLDIEGVLKDSIQSIVTKTGIKTNVFSSAGRPNWAGGTTPVNKVSSYLSSKRPHTNPSKKFNEGTAFIKNIFSKHANRVLRQLAREGLL